MSKTRCSYCGMDLLKDGTCSPQCEDIKELQSEYADLQSAADALEAPMNKVIEEYERMVEGIVSQNEVGEIYVMLAVQEWQHAWEHYREVRNVQEP